MKSKNRFQIILLSHWSTCTATTRRGSWSARRMSWRSASTLSSSPTPPRFSGKRSYSWVCTTVKSWRRSPKLTWSCTPGGAAHVESSLPICLKPPGFFNPRAYLVKTRFQSLLSKCAACTATTRSEYAPEPVFIRVLLLRGKMMGAVLIGDTVGGGGGALQLVEFTSVLKRRRLVRRPSRLQQSVCDIYLRFDKAASGATTQLFPVKCV
jgi:hypothetical protein